jgi:hypothetical protein
MTPSGCGSVLSLSLWSQSFFSVPAPGLSYSFPCKTGDSSACRRPKVSSQAMGCVLDHQSLFCCRSLIRQFTKSSPPMVTEPVGVPSTGKVDAGVRTGLLDFLDLFRARTGEAGGMQHSSLWRPSKSGPWACLPCPPLLSAAGHPKLLLVIKCCWLSGTCPRPCVLCQLWTSLFLLC